MTSPVRVALVGLGWWGRKMLTVLDAASDEIAVVRIVETDLEAATQFTSGRAVLMTDRFADAIEDADIDAVIIATPHSFHEEQVIAAALAGKHVFCEKPLALTSAGARAAAGACEKAGVVLGMGHERRFEPAVRDLLESAANGKLGRIQQIEANFSHDRFLKLDQNNWRLKKEQAPAAGMTATGIHLLDLSTVLLGRAESVWCVCENLSSELPAGDTVGALVKFAGGGTAYVSASLANPFISRFAVFGSRGWVDIRDKAHVEAPDGWIVTSSFSDGPIEVSEVGPAEPVRDNLVRFARAVRGTDDYPVTPRQMIDNIGLLEAISKSAVSGQIEAV